MMRLQSDNQGQPSGFPHFSHTSSSTSFKELLHALLLLAALLVLLSCSSCYCCCCPGPLLLPHFEQHLIHALPTVCERWVVLVQLHLTNRHQALLLQSAAAAAAVVAAAATAAAAAVQYVSAQLSNQVA
jgi:hypothetical protein